MVSVVEAAGAVNPGRVVVQSASLAACSIWKALIVVPAIRSQSASVKAAGESPAAGAPRFPPRGAPPSGSPSRSGPHAGMDRRDRAAMARGCGGAARTRGWTALPDEGPGGSSTFPAFAGMDRLKRQEARATCARSPPSRGEAPGAAGRSRGSTPAPGRIPFASPRLRPRCRGLGRAGIGEYVSGFVGGGHCLPRVEPWRAYPSRRRHGRADSVLGAGSYCGDTGGLSGDAGRKPETVSGFASLPGSPGRTLPERCPEVAGPGGGVSRARG